MEEQEPYTVDLKLVRGDSPVQDEFVYDIPTIQYLLSLLTDEDKAILKDIYVKTRSNILNYQKTKAPDYQRLRRKYEITWGKLEAQGFIKPIQVTQMRSYLMTANGEQAVALLEEEQK